MSNNNDPIDLIHHQPQPEDEPIHVKCPTDGFDLIFPAPGIGIYDHPVASTILITHPVGKDCPMCGFYYALRVTIAEGRIALYPAQAEKPAEAPLIMKVHPGAKIPRGN